MKDVIVDANIVRAAGTTDCQQSIAARSILDLILHSKHAVVADKTLLTEWNKHQSSFAIEWRAALESQARLVEVTIHPYLLDAFHLAAQRLDYSNRACASKDSHLVLTALGTFSIVVSSELASRGVFSRLAVWFDALYEVLWVHPDCYNSLRSVINDGNRPPDVWRLCFHKCSCSDA